MIKLFVFVITACLLFLSACNPSTSQSASKQKDITLPTTVHSAENIAAAMQASDAEDCKKDISGKTAQYYNLMSRRDYKAAVSEIRMCSQVLNDAKLKSLVADGEVKSYIQDIKNPHLPIQDRVLSAKYLIKYYPQQGKKYEKHQIALNQQLQQHERQSLLIASNKKTYTPKELRKMVNEGNYPKQGETKIESKDLDYINCIKHVEGILDALRVSYPFQTIVTTNNMRTEKVWTNDGTMILSCSALDQKLYITTSPYL